jgi:hypothetical protein
MSSFCPECGVFTVLHNYGEPPHARKLKPLRVLCDF